MSLTRQSLTHARSPKSGGATWSSRDYDLPIVPCKVAACPVNKSLFCAMASAIEIGADGRCKTGQRFIESAPKVVRSPLQRPTPPDGD